MTMKLVNEVVGLMGFVWHWYCIICGCAGGLLAVLFAFLTPNPPREEDERLIYRS